jgi:hypothetical protein
VSYTFRKKLTAQICGQAELVHHTHYNSVLQADSYVHTARSQECQNWLMALLYYSLKQRMAGSANRVVQMIELVVGRTLMIENSRMEALQMPSKHH